MQGSVRPNPLTLSNPVGLRFSRRTAQQQSRLANRSCAPEVFGQAGLRHGKHSDLLSRLQLARGQCAFQHARCIPTGQQGSPYSQRRLPHGCAHSGDHDCGGLCAPGVVVHRRHLLPPPLPPPAASCVSWLLSRCPYLTLAPCFSAPLRATPCRPPRGATAASCAARRQQQLQGRRRQRTAARRALQSRLPGISPSGSLWMLWPC